MLKCRKNKELIICLQQDKISEAMLDWRWYLYWSELPTQGWNFRSSPEVSSLLRSRVLGNQVYFCRNFWSGVGTSDEHRKFCVTSDRGLSGDYLWTDRSDPEQLSWAFWSKKWCYGLLLEELSHLRHKFGYIKVTVSIASTISILVNYLCALTKFVNESPHIPYWIKCLLAKIFKILSTN